MFARLGYWYVLSSPVLAVLTYVGDFRILGFIYTGWIWVICLILGLLLLEVQILLLRERRVAFPYLPWAAWMALLWVSLLWTRAPLMRAVQDACQISMPLVMGMAAAEFVVDRRQLRTLLACFRIALPSLIVLYVADLLGLMGPPSPASNRVLGMTAALLGCVFLAELPQRILPALLGWGVCVALAFMTGSRMATLAAVVSPLFHPLLRGAKFRLIGVAAIALIGLAVFYSPLFQERFFDSGHGNLSDVFQGDFVSSGRFEVWPQIYEEMWKSPVLGAGVGSVTQFVPLVWPDMAHPHNDYLRIAFDLGLVGLAGFLLLLAWQAWDLRRLLRATEGPAKMAATAGLLGLVVFALLATTDNPLVYNLWYTNPLLALIGGAYGVAGNKPLPPAEGSGR